MPRAVQVVRRFIDPKESRQASVLSNAWKLFAPAGEYFVDIALVAYIPDYLIVGNIINFMERDGKFDDTEGGSEMAAGFGDAFGQILSDLRCQSAELFVI